MNSRFQRSVAVFVFVDVVAALMAKEPRSLAKEVIPAGTPRKLPPSGILRSMRPTDPVRTISSVEGFGAVRKSCPSRYISNSPAGGPAAGSQHRSRASTPGKDGQRTLVTTRDTVEDLVRGTGS